MAKKHPKKNPPAKTELSTQKKALFYGITISVPILFFLVIELILRGIDYKGNNALFVDPGIITKEYKIPNPNFASRYFFYTRTVPNPSSDVFLAQKPENGYRVFAMGGSSAAGYPYGFNGTYSRVVKDILTEAMPEKEVEVVNVGISAISSYTLFDQVDEIIEQQPDAVMIYAGHNEFYGALGVGSNENLGGFPGFVRFYLKLQRFKTFLFLRSLIVEAGKLISGSGEDKYDASATLMERIINSRSIELGSPKYELAMHQFESNMSAITSKFEKAGVPVYIGSLASNLKDHAPFVDITDGEQPSAQSIFDEAKTTYQTGDFESAKEQFEFARDLDGLKFRAPSQINEIIEKLTSDTDLVHYVPVLETMSDSIDDGIIGFELMLEHLHPNSRGYFLMGATFADELLHDLNIRPARPLDQYFADMKLTDFDESIARHRVLTLKQSFPFVTGPKPEPYQNTYIFRNRADSLAFISVHTNINWDEAKLELAKYYEGTGQLEKAIAEYRGLIRNQPWNDSPYVFAARLYLDHQDFEHAEPLLEKAYSIYPEEAFTTKMLGAIMVNKGNAQRGIKLLEESRALQPNDPQMLFNLSGAYGIDRQFEKAYTIAVELEEMTPNFPGNRAWIQQLKSIMNRN